MQLYEMHAICRMLKIEKCVEQTAITTGPMMKNSSTIGNYKAVII